MTEFEEQFPSLKEWIKETGNIEFEDAFLGVFNGYEYTDAIQKHCLDKQKVRDAIEKKLTFLRRILKKEVPDTNDYTYTESNCKIIQPTKTIEIEKDCPIIDCTDEIIKQQIEAKETAKRIKEALE